MTKLGILCEKRIKVRWCWRLVHASWLLPLQYTQVWLATAPIILHPRAFCGCYTAVLKSQGINATNSSPLLVINRRRCMNTPLPWGVLIYWLSRFPSETMFQLTHSDNELDNMLGWPSLLCLTSFIHYGCFPGLTSQINSLFSNLYLRGPSVRTQPKTQEISMWSGLKNF